MNAYGILVIGLLIFIAAEYFGVGAAIQQIFNSLADIITRLANIPPFPPSRNPELYAFAIRLAYLIAVIGILRLILLRKKD